MSWCDTCQNTGWVDCLCGGDLCICMNFGEYPCPSCDGFPYEEEDEHDGGSYPLHKTAGGDGGA